jgi:hypothetical protein
MYDDFQSASSAVKDLVDNGFSRDSISFITNDASGEYSRAIGERVDVDTSAAAEGAGVGAGIGAVLGGLGGLLVGLGALAIPGIGPVIAAGPLAAALTTLAGAGAGAVAGGVTGGLIGALADMGVPEDTAHYYAEGLRRGSHLVTVNVDELLVDRVVEILNRYNPVDMNERVNNWRQTGWTGLDTQAAGLTGAGMSAGLAETVDTSPDSPGFRNQAIMRDMNPMEGTDYRTTDMSSDYDDFTIYDTRFRQHFETQVYAGDADYTIYQPAYRYGYKLARDERYKDYRWEDLEPEAHQYWDEQNPGTWERFKASIRHAWEEVKDAGS